MAARCMPHWAPGVHGLLVPNVPLQCVGYYIHCVCSTCHVQQQKISSRLTTTLRLDGGRKPQTLIRSLPCSNWLVSVL